MMQQSGKVVVVSQHYPPDPSTTAAIMAAIGEHVAREADVLVLSGTAGSAAKAAGGKPQVVEVGNWMPGKAALLKRALAELLFTIRMFAALLAKLRRGDVALTVPAPFMLPYAFAAAAKLKGARSVLIMHDLYPDVLIMAGLLKPDSLPASAMRGLNALMFRMLDAVVVIGRDTEKLLLRYGGMTSDKIRFIPNWATLARGVRAVDPEILRRPAFLDSSRRVEIDLVRQHDGAEHRYGKIRIVREVHTGVDGGQSGNYAAHYGAPVGFGQYSGDHERDHQ